MNDTELDDFFIQTLKKILEITKDDAAYVANLTTQEYEEIKEDYQYMIEDLSEIIKNTKTLDDLAEADEETITAVFDYIASYSDNFIISANEPQKKRDLEEYSKLEELMDLFFDSDDEYEEESEE